MRIKPILLLGLLMVVSLSAHAAVEFKFRQMTYSDVDNLGSSDITAIATIEGGKSRVEFIKGSLYPYGTYLISTDGSRTMLVVNPTKKTYAEINHAAVAAALGNSKIQITNLKSNLQTLSDHPEIADFPTDHYRLEMSYDMTVTFGTIPLKQTVKTVIDKWTTTAFGDVAGTLLDEGALRTGNPQLDELIDAEIVKVKGFPLRQVIEISTTMYTKGAQNSQLKLNPSRRQKTEILVSKITKKDVSTTIFDVPRGFQKLDGSQQAKEEKNPVHILNMEPATDNDGR
ncbi:MAG TPA: hypothetical protein VIL97_06360 [Thermoanaerobaculia bacterium]